MISFESKIDVIDTEILKRRAKWFLHGVAHIGFEDVAQIIRLHIYNKWSKWDQTKPLEPWINRIITNQLRNLIRNNYGSFAKPCTSCPFNESVDDVGNDCGFTSDRKQSIECPVYAKWAQSKKDNQFNINLAKSYDVHDFEIESVDSGNSFDIDRAAERLHEKMKEVLNPKDYEAYTLLFVLNISDEEAAKRLNYTTSEANRKAGYGQIRNLREKFSRKAKELIQKGEIFLHA